MKSVLEVNLKGDYIHAKFDTTGAIMNEYEELYSLLFALLGRYGADLFKMDNHKRIVEMIDHLRSISPEMAPSCDRFIELVIEVMRHDHNIFSRPHHKNFGDN